MEAVENDPDILALCAPHHFPGIPVIPDMPPPGQCLIADTHAAPGGARTQFGEIGCEPVDPSFCLGRERGADEKQVAAQLLQQVEFALGTVQGALAARFREALEIAERLAGDDRQSEVIADASDFRW